MGTCNPLYTPALQYAAYRTREVRIFAALYTAQTEGKLISTVWLIRRGRHHVRSGRYITEEWKKLNRALLSLVITFVCYCNYWRDNKNSTMLWTCRSHGNNKHIRNSVKQIIGKTSHWCLNWDEAVLVENLKEDRVDGAWGLTADYHVTLRSDYNVLCLYTSSYVTTGNSRVVSECKSCVGTHQYHLQSRINETVLLDTRQCISL
jgi:hypothetical protein